MLRKDKSGRLKLFDCDLILDKIFLIDHFCNQPYENYNLLKNFWKFSQTSFWKTYPKFFGNFRVVDEFPKNYDQGVNRAKIRSIFFIFFINSWTSFPEKKVSMSQKVLLNRRLDEFSRNRVKSKVNGHI